MMTLKSALVAAVLSSAFVPLASHGLEQVEANVTFALKMYINNTEEAETDKSLSKNYATVTLKTADVIRACGDFLEVEFSKKARLVRRTLFGQDGDVFATGYYVVDPAQPADTSVGDYLARFILGYPGVVDKFKYKLPAGTGTLSTIERSLWDLTLDDENAGTTDEDLKLYGLDKTRTRRVAAGESTADLETRTSAVHGDATFYVVIKGVDGYLEGIVQGTVKVTGSKLIAPF